MEPQNRTIVTGFFDLQRDKWPVFYRSLSRYFDNGKKNLSINENMIIFIENKFFDFVKKAREDFPDKTHIIIIDKKNLPKYKLYDRIKNIMTSPEFRNGIVDPTVPEMWNPEYNIIMWSKVDMVKIAIKINLFKSTHFCWLDFGLGDYAEVKDFPAKFHDPVRILCRSEPEKTDLDRVKMCKSHTNRFTGGFFTGRYDYMLQFIEAVDKEIETCMDLGVVDCDQTMFSNVYLQKKDIFEIYYGEWRDVFTKYDHK